MFPIVPPNEINKIQFDLILIAVSSLKFSNEIKKKLKDMGIDQNKVVDVFSDRKYMNLLIDQRIAFNCIY